MLLNEKIQQLKYMLNAKPLDLAIYIFSATNITIRYKISIIAACLNDKRMIEIRNIDPKDRNRTLQKAIDSLERLILKRNINHVHSI